MKPVLRISPKSSQAFLTSLQFSLLLAIAPAVMAAELSTPPTFKVSVAKGYKPVKPALRGYLSGQTTELKGVQHFCIIGYHQPSKDGAKESRIAWVHWKEGQRLVQWAAAAEGFTSSETLLHASRDLDLAKDVAPDKESVASSTYTVDQKWVAQLLQDCSKRGERFSLSRH